MYRRRRSRIRFPHAMTGLIAATALAVSCGRTTTAPDGGENVVADAAASVAKVAAAVTGQTAPLAEEQLDGTRHMGFDTHTYPGDRTMLAWKNAKGAPYKWVGFYLPAPCHRERSWTGKRDTLTKMGWGLAAIYVGQQTWGRTPKPLTPAQVARLATQGATCNSNFLGADRGAAEGRDAIAATLREGFPPRSVVFLDIERMEKMPERMRDYYRAWSRTLLQDGRYLPGVYVHAHNAAQVHADLKAEFVAAGVTAAPRIWVATGRGYEEGKAPQDVGFIFAGVWQGMIDVAKSVANIRLPVDVNVATWSSPSEPDVGD